MTTILYSLARKEHDGDGARYLTLLHGVHERVFCARLEQDGVERRVAYDWAVELALSARAALDRHEQAAALQQVTNGDTEPFGSRPYAAAGDAFEHPHAGRLGTYSYRVVATAVHAAVASL